MKFYFYLQYLMINRSIKEAGLQPVLAYTILTIGFPILSWYLFKRTEYAPYVYVVAGVSISANLSATQRSEFVRQCFGDKKFRQIRLIENLLLSFPFVVFLLYKHLFLFALILLVLSAILALVHFSTSFGITVPTPFSARPFEFSTGFRNSYYLLIAAYAVTAIAITVKNYNLALFAVLMVFVVVLNYYTKPEPEYYVWIYKFNAKTFLIQKIKTALLFSSSLALPVALMAGVSFREFTITLPLIFTGGLTFVVGMIVNKYASFPGELSIVQVILLVLCLLFPPLLIIMIPYFFFKSCKRLSYLLP